MSNILQLGPRELYEFITGALGCRQVPYIAGPPGIGKSQIVQQVANDAEAKVIDLRLSQMLSEDLTGIPERDAEKGKAYYLPFDRFPLEGDEVPDGYNGWMLFLDELSSATEEVLAAIYSVILDRVVGGHKLHPKCLVIAAGNRASDSAIARELPDTLITRMLPCEMKVKVNDWSFWAKHQAKNKNDAVISFIEKHPNMLYTPLAKDAREELETYATPRGWEKVFAHVNAHEKLAASKPREDDAGIPIKDDEPQGTPLTDLTYHLIIAAVGPMAAKAFKEDYDENISLPFPWEVAASPSSTRIPSAHIAKAKLIKNLADHYVTQSTQTQDALLVYVNRVGGEYGELMYNEISGRLGDTTSDHRMRTLIRDRLHLDNGGSSSSSNNSFR